MNLQPVEVTPLGLREKWRQSWIFGTKIVPEWCQYGDEAIASVCQRKNTEFFNDVLYVRESRE